MSEDVEQILIPEVPTETSRCLNIKTYLKQKSFGSGVADSNLSERAPGQSHFFFLSHEIVEVVTASHMESSSR